MSIFDNIRNTPNDETVDLVIALKYGDLRNVTTDTIASMPDSVVIRAFELLNNRGYSFSYRRYLIDDARTALHNCLTIGWALEASAKTALTQALKEYHTLYG